MATARVRTVGATGRQYANMQLFEDAIPANIVTTDETWTGECYNDSEFTQAVTFSGTTTDATRWIKLTTGTDQSFRDHADKLTNPLAYDQSKGVGLRSTAGYTPLITIGENNVTIENLQLQSPNGGGTKGTVNSSGVRTGIVVNNMLMHAQDLSSSFAAYLYNTGNSITNSILICDTTTGSGLRLGNGARAYNCTAVVPSTITNTSGTGFLTQYANNVVKNCASFGFNTDFASSGFHTDSDYNASDSTGSPGANSVDSLTFADQFEVVTTSGMDFRAKSGNGLQVGAADTTLDIIGQTRANPPTIGAWELVAGGGDTSGTFASTASSTFNAVGTLIHAGTFSSTSNSALVAVSSLSLNASFASTANSSLSANSSLVNHGAFASVSASALSAVSSLRYNESFSSSTTTAVSFNGSLVTAGSGSFASVTSSTSSFVGSLRLNAAFSTNATSAVSFAGTLNGNYTGTFESVTSSTLDAQGRLVQYSNLSSTTLSTLAAVSALSSSNRFSSAASSVFNAVSTVIQYRSFSSSAQSTLGIFNIEPPASAGRTISSSASNRIISSSGNSRIIYS